MKTTSPVLNGKHLHQSSRGQSGVQVIKADDAFTDSDHGFPRFWGVCDQTCPTDSISMAVGSLGVGQKGTAHAHPIQTAIFILKGTVLVRFWVGEGPAQEITASQNAFVFIDKNVVHQPINIGAVPMQFAVARPLPVAD